MRETRNVSSASSLISPILYKDTAFLIADTSLLRKSGRNFQYISNTFLHIIDKVTIPIYLKLLFDKKPIDALIQALESLLPWLTKSFKKLIFLCDAGLTCGKPE